MIFTRTPFRLTLGGGGTDLPSYYSQHGGFIFAVALDKYMYLNVNRPIVDDLVRVKYTKSETVPHVDELQHEIAREAMRLLGFERALEITSMADVPAGTGLGSSSAYAVGLLHALHVLKREHVSLEKLAEEACHLEINVLGKPIGKQDQYLAAFGGLTVLEIDRAGKVISRSAQVSPSLADDLNRNLLLFHTRTSRNANEILAEQNEATKAGRTQVVDSLHRIKELGYKILEAVETGNLTDVGRHFDEHWQHKKKLSEKISNPEFDKIYDQAKANGAIGGKISGAGGGGFFTFYIEAGHRQFRQAMQALGLRELHYRFDTDGSKVLVNF